MLYFCTTNLHATATTPAYYTDTLQHNVMCSLWQQHAPQLEGGAAWWGFTIVCQPGTCTVKLQLLCVLALDGAVTDNDCSSYSVKGTMQGVPGRDSQPRMTRSLAQRRLSPAHIVLHLECVSSCPQCCSWCFSCRTAQKQAVPC